MLTARSPSAVHIGSLVARALVSCRAYSKDYASSSDDEDSVLSKKPKTKVEPATKKDVSEESKSQIEESTKERLNRLLASMQTDSKTFENKIFMAKPGETNRKNKEKFKQAVADKDIFEAAKRVATLLGETNSKKTESELLSKLLGHNIDEVAATKNIDGEPNLKSAGNENELSLSELIVGMKIDRSKPSKSVDTRADYVRHSLAAKGLNKRTEDRENVRGSRPQRDFQRTPESYTGSVNLFGGEPIGIFKNIEQFKPSADILHTWKHLKQRELELQVFRPPANYFDKMALWTEQGKLWRFPIDNEQDISPEIASEDFSDHIFLEQHLESWCPNKGPIRHFMELVCVGLSKNPYITAKEKKEHILWYRDYFEAKKDILKDLMSQEKMEQTAIGSKTAEV